MSAWAQPMPVQESAVQTFPSSQFRPAWAHPVAGSQVSTVQTSPSLQEGVMSEWEQPEPVQESAVQRFPSSQFKGGPLWQVPPLQTSPAVQGLPSLQLPVRLTWLQASVDGLHVSPVQGLASSHSGVPRH